MFMSDNSAESKTKDDQSLESPGFFQVMWSTLAAFFGVQNSKNRERDFNNGKALHFIFMGILMTVAFIATVMLAVKFALSAASGG